MRMWTHEKGQKMFDFEFNQTERSSSKGDKIVTDGKVKCFTFIIFLTE